MNPSMHADLVLPALENCRNHLGMQQRADSRDEEGYGNLMTIQQFQNARQSGLRAKISGRERSGRGLATRQQIRFVVDIEADTHRYPRISRPGARSKLSPDPRTSHGSTQLFAGPIDAGLCDLLPKTRDRN